MKIFRVVLMLTFVAGFCILHLHAQTIVINEIMSSNTSSVKDDFGQYSDWMELYNFGAEPVNLEGFGISDDPGEPFKWVFPVIVMNPGDYLVVWASGHDKRPVEGYMNALMYERYDNIPGHEVSSLLNHPSFPDHPTHSHYLHSFDAPEIIEDNYGARIQGYLTPPETGNYVFWIDSDDEGLLSLSSNESEEGLVDIASVPGWTRRGEWSKYPEQQSGLVYLVKGKKYYVRALLKQEGGGDHLTVRWRLPSGKLEEPIPASRFLWSGGDLHTNFSLSKEGETITLTRPDGVIVDQVEANILNGLSYGRQPDGTGNWVYFGNPTPWKTNSGPTYTGILKDPFFSTPGGFYQEDFDLQLYHNDPDVTIYYTTDGSDPSPLNLSGTGFNYRRNYRKLITDPEVEFFTRESATRIYDGTIPVRDLTGVGWSQADVNTRWEVNPVEPRESPQKGTVVRAIAYKKGYLPSKVVTHTYIVSNQPSPLPVVSLVLPEASLFDYEKGIYVAGKIFEDWRKENWEERVSGTSPANWSQRSEEWERETNIEFFDQNGIAQLNQLAGLRIHGGWSRIFPQKSLRLYARTQYGDNEFRYKFFADKDTDIFKNFILRTSGSDFDGTFFRDAFIQRLVKNRPLDIQHWQPTITFLNGEYWGIHNLRDRIDNYYLANKYGFDPEKVDILTRLVNIKYGDSFHYWNMYNYALNNDMSNPLHYEHINTMMDVENYAEYNAFQVYINNQDWPENNIDYWRYKTDGNNPDAPYGHDGRWRWIIYDTDYGFWLWDYGPWENTLEWATRTDARSTELFRNMLKNKDFSNLFINRLADFMNATFHPDTVLKTINEMQQVYEPAMTDHINRWKRIASKTAWYEEINKMKNYGSQRPGYMRTHIQDYFNLSGNYQVSLTAASGKGTLRINTIKLDNPSEWKGVYFNGVPVELEAIAAPNYRFSRWEGFVTSTSETITVTSNSNLSLVAHFEPTDEPVIINYWLFDSSLSNDTPFQSLDDSYHVSNTGKIIFHSALSGYPYSPGHPLWRKASMERRNLPTSVNYRPLANSNKSYQDASVLGIQVKQPFAGVNTENMLVFQLPANGFRNLVFSFAASNDNAAESLLIDYSIGEDEASWTTQGLSQSQYPLSSEYQLYSVNFASCNNVNDNSYFRIRIRFRGNSLTADNGGRVNFNNICLEGIPIPGYNKPPQLLSNLPLRTSVEGGAPVAFDLSAFFSDPEGDKITYSALSSRPAFVQTSVSGSTLQLTPLLTGDATITILADDGHNPPLEQTFRMIVYPAAHVLSNGEYSFTQWDQNTPELIYPQHMMFLQSDVSDPGMGTPLLYPYHIEHNDYHPNDLTTIGFPYNNTGRTRINGLDEQGISFINTGRKRDVGGALVALNTKSMQTVRIRWSGGTVSRGEQLYALRLQYRVGTEGPFSDVVHTGRVAQYMAGPDGEYIEFPAVNLPPSALNHDYVQLLWRYYHINGESGNRSQLRLDDIIIGNMLSDDAMITSFAFKDITPIYHSVDHIKKLIRVGMATETNIAALTPVLTLSASATVTPAPSEGVYGPMDFSSPVTFTVTSQSGRIINEYTVIADNRVNVDYLFQDEVAIYPNPASHSVQVSSSIPMQRIDLVDTSGRLLQHHINPGAQHTLSVGNYSAGIYILRVYKEKGVTVSKLQITR